jgi:two-component system, chemotaxis family, protein-glutamate methylesterase/glutaminase
VKPPIRVLVVDDSAFARKVVRDVLSGEADIEVVGIARDGLDALEKIAELSPDVVTLDLLMPNLDGLGVLRALAGRASPRVVVVSTAEQDGELAVEALQAGAVDIVHKPTSLATARLYELSQELVSKVKTAALARPNAVDAPGSSADAVFVGRPQIPPRVVVIGTSTGGPQALTRLLSALPADLPVPVALVLHMPVGYTAALAARLDGISPLEVVEATEGLTLRPGLAVLGRAGVHMRLVRDGDFERVHLDVSPLESPHRPSVDELFLSAARTYGGAALGVVLTGMGEDGLQGARALAAAGAWIFTESMSSCVVYGMPRAVVEAGLSTRSLPLADMAAAIRGVFAPARPAR